MFLQATKALFGGRLASGGARIPATYFPASGSVTVVTAWFVPAPVSTPVGSAGFAKLHEIERRRLNKERVRRKQSRRNRKKHNKRLELKMQRDPTFQPKAPVYKQIVSEPELSDVKSPFESVSQLMHAKRLAPVNLADSFMLDPLDNTRFIRWNEARKFWVRPDAFSTLAYNPFSRGDEITGSSNLPPIDQVAPEMLCFDLRNASQAEIIRFNKAQAMKFFERGPGDTGSSEVQIAVLTIQIEALVDHLNKNKKDRSAKRGLEILWSRRKRLMAYLKRDNFEFYRKAVIGLGLTPL